MWQKIRCKEVDQKNRKQITHKLEGHGKNVVHYSKSTEKLLKEFKDIIDFVIRLHIYVKGFIGQE